MNANTKNIRELDCWKSTIWWREIGKLEIVANPEKIIVHQSTSNESVFDACIISISIVLFDYEHILVYALDSILLRDFWEFLNKFLFKFKLQNSLSNSYQFFAIFTFNELQLIKMWKYFENLESLWPKFLLKFLSLNGAREIPQLNGSVGRQ